MKTLNLPKMAEDMLTSSAVWNHESFPFSAKLHPGDERVMFVAGDNGEGKSYFVEWMRLWGRTHRKVDATISISIRERTGAGLSDVAGMRKSMIFGDESRQSTGATSVEVIGRAFSNLDDWTKPGRRVMMVLDEPEMGLSRSFSNALGAHMAGLMQGLASKAAGVIIVTHDRELTRSFIDVYGEQPSFVHMGKADTLEQWISTETARSIDDLMLMRDRANANRRVISDIEKSFKGAK